MAFSSRRYAHFQKIRISGAGSVSSSILVSLLGSFWEVFGASWGALWHPWGDFVRTLVPPCGHYGDLVCTLASFWAPLGILGATASFFGSVFEGFCKCSPVFVNCGLLGERIASFVQVVLYRWFGTDGFVHEVFYERFSTGGFVQVVFCRWFCTVSFAKVVFVHMGLYMWCLTGGFAQVASYLYRWFCTGFFVKVVSCSWVCDECFVRVFCTGSFVLVVLHKWWFSAGDVLQVVSCKWFCTCLSVQVFSHRWLARLLLFTIP